MKNKIGIVLVAAMLLSGCAVQYVKKGEILEIGGKKYWVASAGMELSCLGNSSVYLFDEKAERLLAVSHASGATLPCAALQGAVAGAAVGGGIAAAGSDEVNASQKQQQNIRPDLNRTYHSGR